MKDWIKFKVNDLEVRAAVSDGDMPLVDYLHERQGLTGTKFSCGIGVCRACTVAVRPQPGAPLEKMLTCSTPVSMAEGAHIFTVEGLSKDGKLSDLQKLFLTHFSFQCGYCAPGFLMAGTVLLERVQLLKESQGRSLDEAEIDAEIRNWVGDNLCRCTGYVKYIAAIKEAVQTGGVSSCD